MIEQNALHYIPGEKSSFNAPLDRYLPPVRYGVVSTWLDENIPEGDWLLDPFGISPKVAIEAARVGYNIIVAANNPINRFILEMLCNPPSQSDFQSALAMLATSQVGSERMEPHIKSLYETICEGCSQIIQAEAFLWKRGENIPFARIYNCPFCGEIGEKLVSPIDIEKASRFSKRGLHYSRALERVTPLHDPDRRHVEEALEVYLPRAIYALVTIINKLSKIPTSDKNRELLSAILLLAFDRSNTLWLYPKERQRPKQLTIPPQFREHNIWLALETAVDLWTSEEEGVPFSIWPDLPPAGGGICIYEGRIKDLAVNQQKPKISAVITSFPRPNQAFWTLSALWSGWLWGPEAVEHYKGVLRRRRYDWGWHTSAIQSALNSLNPHLQDGTPFFGMINEVEPGFLSAVVIGSRLANMELRGSALRPDDGQAQFVWQCNKEKLTSQNLDPSIENIICNSAKNYLQKHLGEPSRYIRLHLAGLNGLVKGHLFDKNISPNDYISQIHSSYQEALGYKNNFLRYEGNGKSIEVGWWWIKDNHGSILPLTDRIEMMLVDLLLKKSNLTFSEIDKAICQFIPGSTTPEIEMIQMCLDSYGDMESTDPYRWSLQEGDLPGRRRGDIKEIEGILVSLGNRLGFNITTEDIQIPMVKWIDPNLSKAYNFYLSTSAVIGKYLSNFPIGIDHSIIVLPGSRSNLVAYKLSRNQYLKETMDQKFQFAKYRLIRQLAESINLTKENLDGKLSLDPLTYTKPQMRLF